MVAYAVGICTLGVIRIEHEIVFCNQQWPMNCERRVMVQEGYTIDLARNLTMQRALDDGDLKYVMFWDDDVLPRRNDPVVRILGAMEQNPQAALIGGVYPRRTEHPEPIVIKSREESAWWGWQDGGMHRVYMSGTGFLMLRLAAFRDLPDLQVDQVSTEDGEKIDVTVYFRSEEQTDDFYLANVCERHGLAWYVLGDVVCNQIDLDGKMYRVEDARVQPLADAHCHCLYVTQDSKTLPAYREPDPSCPIHGVKQAVKVERFALVQ